MPTNTDVTNLKINVLTEAQYDTAVQGGVIGANELSILTDVTPSGSGYHPDLFDFKWADHEIDNMSWLRADTFSWQSESAYSQAYWELFYDIQISTYWYLGNVGPAYTKSRTPAVGDAVYLNSNLTTQIGTVAAYDDVNDAITVGANTYTFMSNTYVTPTTETVAGHTLTVYTGHSGRKIVGQVNEYDVSLIYNDTGVAWYYIIDLNNKRFKLPRTKFGMTGLRDTVGNYVEPGLPNITGYLGLADRNGSAEGRATGAFSWNTLQGTNGYAPSTNTDSADAYFDASQSNSIYGNSTTVQPPATQMYLYFYVGEFTQIALENTAGLNASLFNGKMDLDAGNITTTAISNLYDSMAPDYTAGVTKAANTLHTATEDGWVFFYEFSNGDQYVTIDGVQLRFGAGNGAQQYTGNSIMLPIANGSTYQAAGNLTFFPLKGV